MKIPNWVLSKWLFYGLVFIFLFFMLLYLLPLALNGNNLAGNFFAEIFGLVFTVGVLAMIFDLREWLEWKRVEDRVKRKIGRKIDEIFRHLSLLCIVKRPHGENTIQEIYEMQLNVLASEEVKLNAVYKKSLLEEDERLYYATFAEASRAYLAEIEHRYSKFLDSEIRTSLMDIQDYLEKLRWQFRLMPKRLPARIKELMPKRKELFYRSVSDLIGKIMKEILKLKREGFWVDWRKVSRRA